ncbi:hypothetical protein ASF41_22085 [Methylobacterium sp. Leaf111]|nr:hypothetical protein ASF41_22085 [Methylobacterium sp. Leaf111]
MGRVMRVITASPGYQKIVAPSDDDLTILLGNQPRTGGLDVIAQGRKVMVRDGNLGGFLLKAGGFGPRFDVLNTRSDVSKGEPRDVFGVTGKFGAVVVDRSRWTGVHGAQERTHGDVSQGYDGCDVDLFLIRRSTIKTAYQALMAKILNDGRGIRRLVLQDMNIDDEPTLRVQQSVAVLLMGCQKHPASIELRNAWINWPGREWHRIAKGDRVTVKGEWNVGLPPGGDFCPA